ncbi:MAG: prepilin peptidase, partial [Evtepia sp.]
MDTLTLLNCGILFILGLLIGSFLNVCILRIPNGDSIVRESSHCFSCGARLRWFELIPLFSYLFLGGHCAHCKAKISIQYPLVELGNALLWI